MKKAILCCFVFAIIAGSARAADLQAPVLKAAPLAVYDWSGIYVGANAGYARSNKCWTAFVALGPRDEGCHEPKGFMGGAQAGFNWQAGHWLLGVEGEYSAANLRGDHSSAFSMSNSVGVNQDGFAVQNDNPRLRAQVRDIGTIAARIGLTSDALDRTLFYVKGGAAWVHDNYSLRYERVSVTIINPAPPRTVTDDLVIGSSSATRWGWTVGTGFEYALSEHLSTFVEYDFIDFGTRAVKFNCTASGNNNACSAPFSVPSLNINEYMNQVKLGLNVRF